MRIADILAAHIKPGATVVDLTSRGDELSPVGWLPPEFGLTYTHESRAFSPHAAAPTLVLHDLPAAADAKPPIDLEPVTPGVVHIVLFGMVEAPIAHGLLDAATRAGWELAATHLTGHEQLRFGLVFAAPGDAADRGRLRLLNEYRYDKLLLRVRTEEVARLEERVQKVESRARNEERQREATEARLAAQGGELADTRKRLDETTSVLTRLRERLVDLEGRLTETRKQLVAARTSVSFRIGRATRVAVREARRSNALGAPRRWLSTFLGPDEILGELDPRK